MRNFTLTPINNIDMDKNRDLSVKIHLEGVSDMNFDGLSNENVIDRLFVDDSLGVSIEAAAGLYGTCNCKSVRVDLLAIKPYR